MQEQELEVIRPIVPRRTRLRKRVNNKKMVQAFIKNNFNISAACRDLRISNITWYSWVEKYPDLKYELEMAKDQVKDDIESVLLDKARGGDTQILIYLGKTLLKDRGYGSEGNSSSTANTQVNIVLPEDTSKKYEWWGGKGNIDEEPNTDNPTS